MLHDSTLFNGDAMTDTSTPHSSLLFTGCMAGACITFISPHFQRFHEGSLS